MKKILPYFLLGEIELQRLKNRPLFDIRPVPRDLNNNRAISDFEAQMKNPVNYKKKPKLKKQTKRARKKNRS